MDGIDPTWFYLMNSSLPPWLLPHPPLGINWEEDIDWASIIPLFGSRETAAQYVEEIKRLGNASFKDGNDLDAAWKYSNALFICRQHNLRDFMDTLHANSAAAYLRQNLPIQTVYHSAACIDLNPNYDKAYYRRAEAMKLWAALSGAIEFGPQVISDYGQCYRLSKNVDVLCAAVMTAVDTGNTHLLPVISEQDFINGVSDELLQKIVQHSEFKPSYLEFLLTDMRIKCRDSRKPFDASKLDFKQLMERNITSLTLLKKLLTMGLQLSQRDLKRIIQVLPDSRHMVLELALKHCPGANLNLLAQTALHEKKQKSLQCLLQCGAKPPLEDLLSFINWDMPDTSFVEYVVNGMESESQVTETLMRVLGKKQYAAALVVLGCPKAVEGNVAFMIDLASIELSHYLRHAQLLEKLIRAGANPQNPTLFAKILQFDGKSSFTSAHVDLLCTLLQNKASTSNLELCYSQTTPLHIATDVALKTGNTQMISVLMESSDYCLPQSGKVVDKKGQTPYHLVVKSSVRVSLACKVCVALSCYPEIDPTIKDKAGKKSKGKKAIDYISADNLLHECLLKAERGHRKLIFGESEMEKAPEIDSGTCPGDAKSNSNLKEAPFLGRSQKLSNRVNHIHTNSDTSPVIDDAAPEEVVSDATKVLHPIQEVGSARNEPTKGQSDKHVKAKANTVKKNTGPISSLPQKENTSSSSTKEVPPSQKAENNKGHPKVDGNPPIPNTKPESHKAKSKGSQKRSMADKAKEAKQEAVTPLDQAITTVLAQELRVPTFSRNNSSTPKSNPLETKVVANGENEGNVADDNDVDKMDDKISKPLLTLDFDNQSFEVEVTPHVYRMFKEAKKTKAKLLKCSIETLFELSKGKGESTSKSLFTTTSGPELYLISMSNCQGQILWEKAVQFSARLTEKKGNYTYSDTLRIWDVVECQDPMDSTVLQDIEQINDSYQRGLHASVNLFSSLRPSMGKNVPRCFKECSVLPSTAPKSQVARFVPAASMKKGEYSAIPFYTITDSFLNNLLCGSSRSDTPFNQWPKEFDIINLPEDETVLLLGRSGTGKTTCCLYRMWKHFQEYWNPRCKDACGIPRSSPTLLTALSIKNEMDDEAGEKNGENEGNEEEVETQSPVQQGATPDAEFDWDDWLEDDNDASPVSADPPVHLHQVFITKNPVLCTQLRKKFYDFASSCHFLSNHMDFEKAEIPEMWSDVEDLAYPLFLTSRQLLLLLDRSLGEEKDHFFRVSSTGRKPKIISNEYSYEAQNILPELHEEENDENDVEDDVEVQQDAADLDDNDGSDSSNVWTEVTATYFVSFIWREICRKCSIKHLDPSLVWMEIKSFIKGSALALKLQQPLSLDQYKALGKKMAPNYSSHRDEIYRLFKAYQIYRQNCPVRLFDECDLIQHIHKRILETKDFQSPIHKFYLDEVQDFTQAELLLITGCAQKANGHFFTGDTAQSIMKGVSFRFKDLRSIFSEIHKNLPSIALPKIYELTTNFRSHSGILELAGSIIDLLVEFFKNSFDSHLPRDRGILEGPSPVFLESCSVGDLAMLLRVNKRETSPIEFGAHQVILVRSTEAKKNLPDVLKSAIVLTVFEAKGLEFDDVLLYNFFADSTVDKRAWRVITSYLESHPNQETTNTSFSSQAPRSLPFDPMAHKSLNSELKCLYTAVTRAKCNLWMYDSNKEKRLPVFDYWYKRGVVKFVRVDQGMASLVFATVSSSEQWKSQGDHFKKRRLWEQALHCYSKADSRLQYLQKEVSAYQLVKEAELSHTAKSRYLDAALSFLEAYQLHPDVRYISNAALCLSKARPPKHITAAKLYEKIGKDEKAVVAFEKARDFENCVRIYEKLGKYYRAVELLDTSKLRVEALARAEDYAARGVDLRELSCTQLALKYSKIYIKHKDPEKLVHCSRVLEKSSKFNESIRILDDAKMALEALEKADSLEKSGVHVAEEIKTSSLAYKYGKEYVESNDMDSLEKVSKYIVDKAKLARLWKQSKEYDRVLRLYEKQRMYQQAYRLLSGQKRFDEALQLAQVEMNSAMRNSFVLQKVKYEIFTSDVVSSETVSLLKSLPLSSPNSVTAHALLLSGKVQKNVKNCRNAQGIYKSLGHKIGELEAFAQIVELVQNPDSESEPHIPPPYVVLNMCIIAKNMSEAVRNQNPLILQHMFEFYGLQKAALLNDMYHTPPDQDIWIGPPTLVQGAGQGEPPETDLDGMLILDGENARKVIAKHIDSFVSYWLKSFDLKAKLEAKLLKSSELKSFHKELSRKRLLSPNTAASVSPDMLRDYICIIINCVKYYIATAKEDKVDGINSTLGASLILLIFSPQISMHLPLVKYKHIYPVRNSEIMRDAFDKWMKKSVKDKLKNYMMVQLDTWLAAWKVCSISGVGTDGLLQLAINEGKIVDGLQQAHVASKAREKFHTPPQFKFWKSSNSYFHIFFFFLRSCNLIRKERNVLVASQCIMEHFFYTIARQAKLGVVISVPSVVNILSVHTTVLLAMITQSRNLQGRAASFAVPKFFQQSVQQFDDLNAMASNDRWVLSAGSDQVEGKLREGRQYLHFFTSKIMNLLWKILHLLLGFTDHTFNVLTFSLKNVESEACRNCLILVLTIFANLAVSRHKPNLLQECHKSIATALEKAQKKKCPAYITEAYVATQRDDFTVGVFGLIQRLLLLHDPQAKLAMITYNPKSKYKFDFYPITSLSTEPITEPQSPQVSYAPVKPGVSYAESMRQPSSSTTLQQPNPLLSTPDLPLSVAEVEDSDMMTFEVPKQDQEEEEDPAIVMKFTSAKAAPHTAVLLDPSVDPSGYCTVCGVQLKMMFWRNVIDVRELEAQMSTEEGAGGETVDTDNQEDEDVLEKYEEHVKRDSHITNKELSSRFLSAVDQEFIPLKDKLVEVLYKLQSTDSPHLQSLVTQLVDEITDLVEVSDMTVNNLCEKRAWQEGINTVEKLVYSMQERVYEGEGLMAQILKAEQVAAQQQQQAQHAQAKAKPKLNTASETSHYELADDMDYGDD